MLVDSLIGKTIVAFVKQIDYSGLFFKKKNLYYYQ